MAPPTTVVTPAYPYIEIEFTVGGFRSHTLLAYVDTGFDGYLIIPATQASLLGPSQFTAPWELADGSVVEAEECRGDIIVSGLAEYPCPYHASRGRIPGGPRRCGPPSYDL